MTDILEGDFSLGEVGVSSTVIGSLDGGWGLPVLILTLLLALKYRGISLLRFSFGLGEVLRVASTAATSQARILVVFSFCVLFSGLPVESPLVADFWLPVEAVFNFHVETDGTILACLAEGAFSFNFAEAALEVPSLMWTFSVLSTLLCSLFSLGVSVVLSPSILAAWFLSCFAFSYFFGVLARVSWPLTFFSA